MNFLITARPRQSGDSNCLAKLVRAPLCMRSKRRRAMKMRWRKCTHSMCLSATSGCSVDSKLMLHMLKYRKNVSPFLLLSGNDTKQIPHPLKHAKYKTSQSNHAQTFQILLLTIYCSTVRTHSLQVLQSGVHLVSNTDCRSLNFSWISDHVFFYRTRIAMVSVCYICVTPGQRLLQNTTPGILDYGGLPNRGGCLQTFAAAFMFPCCRSERPCFEPQ